MFSSLWLVTFFLSTFIWVAIAAPRHSRSSQDAYYNSDAYRAAVLRDHGRVEFRGPGSLPNPSLPAGTDTLPGIEHIIVFMEENHSYDNILGMLSRGDGFTLDHNGKPLETNPYPNGSIQHAFRMPTTCQLPSQPSQEWRASHNAFNNGSNNGFVSTPISPLTTEIVGGVAMGYFTAEQLPFTYSLAEEFPIGDRWHCSVLAQTYPNRRFLLGGTALGMTDNVVGNVEAIAPAGTLFTQLDQFNISWTDYVAVFPTGASPLLFGNDINTTFANNKPLTQFAVDAAAGKLPSFSFIDPNFTNQSQENPQNMVVGEALIYDIVQAVGNSPLWEKSLLLIMYDEHGGYYDHVVPPMAFAPDDIPPNVAPSEYTYEGYHRYGFRVPSFVISPYAKPGYTSHVLYDHTSVLATIQRKWNLPSLTYRDSNANDVLDFLDLDALARQEPTFKQLPKLAAPGNTTAALTCSVTGPGVIPPPDSLFPSPN